jgi:hypothetical protein
MRRASGRPAEPSSHGADPEYARDREHAERDQPAGAGDLAQRLHVAAGQVL